MTIATRCPHGMPAPPTCWECMLDGNLDVPPPTVETVEYTFEAEFDGNCTTCLGLLVAGSTIAKLSTGRYVHLDCTP